MKGLKTPKTEVSRREFVRLSALAGAGTILVACGAGGEPAAEAPMEEAPAESAAEAAPASSSMYSEAPILAEMVANGELPPVDERLPVTPLVLEGLDGVGNYGGLWRAGRRGQADHFAINRYHPRCVVGQPGVDHQPHDCRILVGQRRCHRIYFQPA